MRPQAARRRALRQARREPEPIAFYRATDRDAAFRDPLAWGRIEPADFDGLLLPGGHAPGMRQYLGRRVLQAKVAAFWALDGPVGAICHGVLVLAAAIDPATGRSVLAGRRTTCLPKYMERGGLPADRLEAAAATTAPTPPTSRTRSAPRSTTRPAVRARPADAHQARHRQPTTRPPSW